VAPVDFRPGGWQRLLATGVAEPQEVSTRHARIQLQRETSCRSAAVFASKQGYPKSTSFFKHAHRYTE
jgi:hypothetical protein